MGDHIISHFNPAIHEASEQGHLSSEGRCELNFQRDPWQILAAAGPHEPSHPDWRIDFKPDFASAVGHQQHGAKPEEFVNKLKLRHRYGTASKVQNQRPVPVTG